MFAAQFGIIATGFGTATTKVAFLVPFALIWTWITALAVHLYRRVERRRDAVPARRARG
jgi:hypothetical protein